MSLPEREGLLARIRHMRRAHGTSEELGQPGREGLEPNAFAVLEARLIHVEQMVQGLQDSVHREATRQGKRIADLEARVEPAALGRALSDDARERGLGQ